MAWADEMLGMMQEERDGGCVGKGIQLACMTGPGSCRVGNLELEGKDLVYAAHLLHRSATEVSVTAPAGGGKCADGSVYLPALAAGDTVVVYQISDSRFLVLEKVVEP